MLIQKMADGQPTLVSFTDAELAEMLPKGKTASQMTSEERWQHIDRAFEQKYPGCELGMYSESDPEDI